MHEESLTLPPELADAHATDVRLVEIAQRYAPSVREEPAAIISAAAAEFPDLETLIDGACR